MVCDMSLDWYSCDRNDLMKTRVLELNASDERGIQVSTYVCFIVFIGTSSLLKIVACLLKEFLPYVRMYVCSCLSCIRQLI